MPAARCACWGLSATWLRAKELAGMPVTWPEDYYKGDYIIDAPPRNADANPALVQMPDAEGQDVCYDKAMNDILNAASRTTSTNFA